MHDALTLSEGSRRPRSARRTARPPPHLLSTMASLCVSRNNVPPTFIKGLLAASLPHHYKVIDLGSFSRNEIMANNFGIVKKGMDRV